MVKQEDIAEKLGISRTTVARALNGSGSIKESTKENILRIAEEMGYKKNTVGSVLATKKEKEIYVFVVKSINKYYLGEIYKGLEKVQKAYSYLKFTFNFVETDISKPEEQVKKLRNILENKEVDGVIITPLIKKEIKSIVIEYGDKTSFLMLDSYLSENVAYVGSNYFYNAQMTANLLNKTLRKGEKVLLFDSLDDNISSREYYNGFKNFIEGTDKSIIELGLITKDSESVYNKVEKYISLDEVIAIYTPRYTSSLIDILISKGVNLDNIKIIAQSKGNEMQKYLDKGTVVAAVEERLDKVAYQAGKYMIDNIYYNREISKIKKHISPKINIMDNIK